MPGAWNLFSNGELGEYFQFPAAGTPAPSLASLEDVRAQAALQEEKVLAQSDVAIERVRKGEVVVRVVDATGKPIGNTQFVVEQTRHEFLFGCNIYGFDHFRSDVENEQYKRRLAELFNYAEKFYRVCFAHPSMVAITWWDLCDAQSWLKGGGLLRADLTPKPAYEALKKLVHERWHTRLSGTTDAAGRVAVRGFFGQYVIKRADGGATATFALAKEGPKEFAVRLPTEAGGK